MNLAKHSFYRGPNVWSPASGLLLAVQFDTPEGVAFLQWKPGAAQAADALAFLRQAFAVTAAPDKGESAQGIGDARVPAVALVLAAAQDLLTDFCVAPALGRLAGRARDRLTVFLPCDEPNIGLPAWRLAVQACLLRFDPAESSREAALGHLREAYWTFRRTARRHGLNQTTIALARAAHRRDIPHYRIAPPGQFLQLGQGWLRQRLNETATDQTSGLARWLAGDKLTTSSFLVSQGVPTSQPQVVASAEEAVQVFRRLNGPVVVKPRSAGKGRGVAVDLSTDQDVATAFEQAAAHKGGVLVERFVQGHDHRLLVVEGRLVAAARRVPAQVLGDGQHTVRELVHQLNQDPRRGMPFERLLEWVSLDAEALAVLRSASLSPETVPAQGQAVPLRRTANISRGGTSVDVSDQVHPDNRALAERVAGLIGLDVAGIDFLTPDIGRSWRDIDCAVLEVNSSPGLRPHLASNADRDVVGPIVDSLFRRGADGRVPTAGITGSAGKTTTSRMVAAILAQAGMTVGLSTTQGAYVAGEEVRSGDSAGGASARALLLDPRVQAGVFELARGGLVKHGMGIDACDVGVVLNIHDNHLGLNGVHDRQALARVKRLVVENARKLAVLNADEPLCLAMREHVRAPVCLVSEDPGNPEVLAHRAAGGRAAVLDGQLAACVLRLYEGEREVGALAAKDIPATWGGLFRPAIVNAVYAAAVAHGMGIEFGIIAAALGNFQSTAQSNPGRMNIIDGMPYRVLVNWVDGQHATAEMARLVETLEVTGRKHLFICAVGNRPDEFLTQMGQAAASAFDHFVCADWEDLRGRPACAAARLLAQGVTSKGVPEASVTVAATHAEGLKSAFAAAAPGDLLVLATYVSPHAWESIRHGLSAAGKTDRLQGPHEP